MNDWMALEMRTRDLERQESQVEAMASDLEQRIRALAALPDLLQRKKESLRQEAMGIRTLRERLQVAKAELGRERARYRHRGQPVVRKMSIHVSVRSDHTFWAGLSQDIDDGGLFVATYEDLPVGTRIELELSLPGCSGMRLAGEVIWVREHTRFTEDMVPGAGLKLVGLEDEHRRAIQDFFQRRPPLFYELVE